MKSTNPLRIIINLAIFQQQKKYNFHHTCSTRELADITKIFQIEKLVIFCFNGTISQSNKTNYELNATLKATLVQPCVITLKPVKTLIEREIKHYYTVSKHGNNQKNISIDFNSPEIEYIGNEVNIGDIMLEALSLEIPLYPKQKGAQFDAVTITKSGVRPLDRTTNNPFHSLRKLK